VLLKLVVHVALPCLLLAWAGASLRPLFIARTPARAFWLTLAVLGAAVLALLCVVSPSLKEIAALKLAPATLALASAGAFVWIAVEAGLCEEVLFRAILQSRLAPLMKSELGAACVGALVFALAHAPGLWMRADASVAGHSRDVVQVIAYAVAVLGPAGLFLGVMWARTRNLVLVVLLHALTDVLPFIPEFAHRWL
jgi:membrane protease YdiL (CAAX protease family)